VTYAIILLHNSFYSIYFLLRERYIERGTERESRVLTLHIFKERRREGEREREEKKEGEEGVEALASPLNRSWSFWPL
jgi:hypothetical protein